MYGQHNVRASAGNNTGQNTKDTPNPRTEIKIPDPAGNQTRAAELEGRESTDHATATDKNVVPTSKKFEKSCFSSLSGNLTLIYRHSKLYTPKYYTPDNCAILTMVLASVIISSSRIRYTCSI